VYCIVPNPGPASPAVKCRRLSPPRIGAAKVRSPNLRSAVGCFVGGHLQLSVFGAWRRIAGSFEYVLHGFDCLSALAGDLVRGVLWEESLCECAYKGMTCGDVV
jgi:hypothetical protein